MNALQTTLAAVARRLSTTTALGLLALTLAASGTLVSLQGDGSTRLGGDYLSMQTDVTVRGDMMLDKANEYSKDDEMDKDNEMDKSNEMSKADEMGVGTI